MKTDQSNRMIISANSCFYESDRLNAHYYSTTSIFFFKCVLPQEHLDKTRDALSETKRLNHALTERAQNLQRAQEDSELRASELEKHNRSLKEVCQAGDYVLKNFILFYTYIKQFKVETPL